MQLHQLMLNNNWLTLATINYWFSNSDCVFSLLSLKKMLLHYPKYNKKERNNGTKGDVLPAGWASLRLSFRLRPLSDDATASVVGPSKRVPKYCCHLCPLLLREQLYLARTRLSLAMPSLALWSRSLERSLAEPLLDVILCDDSVSTTLRPLFLSIVLLLYSCCTTICTVICSPKNHIWTTLVLSSVDFIWYYKCFFSFENNLGFIRFEWRTVDGQSFCMF